MAAKGAWGRRGVRKGFVWFLFTVFSIYPNLPLWAQNNLQLTLSYFGANPATNRQVALQPMQNFPGNIFYVTSDPVTGIAVWNGAPAGLINGTIQAPPGQRITFQVYLPSGNLGTVDASNYLATGSATTYPAGQTAWAIATSDLRYQLNGQFSSNNFPTFLQATQIASQFFQTGSNFTLQVGQNVSNAITSGGGGASGTGITNFILAVGQNNTNYANGIGSNGTNFATTGFQSGSNLTMTVGQNGTNFGTAGFQTASNFTLTVGANTTNAATGFFQTGSNLTFSLGVNASNNDVVTFQSASNMAAQVGLALTNNLVAATNGLARQTNGVFAGTLTVSNGSGLFFNQQGLAHNSTVTGTFIEHVQSYLGSNNTAVFAFGDDGSGNFDYEVPWDKPAPSASNSITFQNQGTNGFVASNNGKSTNELANSLTVTNALGVGGVVFNQTLTVLGISNSTAAGTYLWYPTPATYSNINDGRWSLQSNSTCLFVSNGVSIFSSSALLGQYAGVGGASAPFPLVTEGGYYYRNGWIMLGTALPGGDTNVWMAITNQAGLAAAAQGALGTNFALLIGQQSTNFATTTFQSGSNYTSTVGNNGTNYANSILQAATNFTLVVGNNISNTIAGGGGGGANAFYTNNPNAFPSVSAPNSVMTVSNLSVVTNLNVGGFLIVTNIAVNTVNSSANGYGVSIGVNAQASSAVGNTTIGVYNAVYSGSQSTTVGNVELSGHSQTNENQYSTTMGSVIDNKFGTVFIYNSSGQLVNSTANNQFIVYTGGGMMVQTNASGGYALNVGGAIGAYSNIVNSLQVNAQSLFGGNQYQLLTPLVLCMTNWSGVDAFMGSGILGSTYTNVTTTSWQNAFDARGTITSNGVACLALSNGVTLATSANLNGPWTLTSPGSGNTPGSFIGSTIHEPGVLHQGVADFQGLLAASLADGTGTFPPASLLTSITNGNGLVQPNVVLVSPTGNDATGQRGTAQAFAHPSAAAQVMQGGDVMYVLNGLYNEPSNAIVGQLPPNSRAIGLGHPIINYTLRGHSTTITTNFIYWEPSDNLYMDNLTFETFTSNNFSVPFGNGPGVAGTATNFNVNFNTINSDSDVIYLAGTNLTTGTFRNCIVHGYWDTFATGNTINTNDFFTFDGGEFHLDVLNGINPNPRNAFQMSIGFGTYILNGTKIFFSNNAQFQNEGIVIGNGNVVLNGVGFSDGGTNFIDIYYLNQYQVVGSAVGLYSMTTNALNIQYNSGANFGFPVDLPLAQLYGGQVWMPMAVSQDPGDDVGAGVYGAWVFRDVGTNGTLILDNTNNQTSSGHSFITYQPDDLNAAVPVPGVMRLNDMKYAGDGSLLTNLPPSAIVATNAAALGVSTYSTNVSLISGTSQTIFFTPAFTAMGPIAGTNYIVTPPNDIVGTVVTSRATNNFTISFTAATITGVTLEGAVIHR